MDISRENVAWAAGLFEGEGSIIWATVRNRNPKLPPWKRCGLSLHMTDEDVVRKFHSIVGVGKVNGPYNYSTKNTKRKSSCYWNVQSFEKMQAVIVMFWPWLGERRRNRYKEILALELQERPTSKGPKRNTKTGRFDRNV